MEEALQTMVREGLPVNSFPAALKFLLDLNATSESSPMALEAFVASYSDSKKYFSIGMAKMREALSPHHGPIATVPHALEMLEEVRHAHCLAIVTVGVPALQYSKLEKAGIDPSIFSKIDVIEEKNKKPSYQALIDEARLHPQEVVVCGDRPSIDLVPAKELHCHTVHLKRGRGLNMQGAEFSSGVIDHAMEDWRSFTTHIERLEKFTIGRA